MTLLKTETHAETLTYYDTFDWRLFNKSLALVEGAGQYSLYHLSDGQVGAKAQADNRPAFAWDFPPGSLRKHLTPILQMRALLALAQVKTKTTTYRALNDDQKTVTYLVSETMWLPQAKAESLAFVRLWLKPVRGYDRQAHMLAGLLQAQGLVAAREDQAYAKIMRAAGRTPGDYSSKIAVQLEPARRADAATKILLRFLLTIMQQNEAGIKQDIDTEFLHDFRVAVRRTPLSLEPGKGGFPGSSHRAVQGRFPNGWQIHQ